MLLLPQFGRRVACLYKGGESQMPQDKLTFSLWPHQAQNLIDLLKVIASDENLPEDYQLRANVSIIELRYPDGLPPALIQRLIVPEIPAIARRLVEITNDPKIE